MAKLKQALSLEPCSELRFTGPFTRVVTARLKLLNPTDRQIAFKVKTTEPGAYCVRPNSGVVEAGGSESVAVMLQPLDSVPGEDVKHRFMVQSTFMAEDSKSPRQDKWWKKLPPESLMRTRLKCVFDLPPAAAVSETESVGSVEENCGDVSTEFQCPVCHEDYQDPKILPCAHLVCRACVLSWVSESKGQGGCPLCRAPIFPSTSLRQSLAHVTRATDLLPSDLVTESRLQNQKMMAGCRQCTLCQDTSATAFCFHCDVRLCPACACSHQKLPVTKDHDLQQLADLTAQKIADCRRPFCKLHADRLVDVYCAAHGELLCTVCFLTSHRECSQAKTIDDLFLEEEKDVTRLCHSLREGEEHMAMEINVERDKFRTMRRHTEEVFDDLLQRVTQQKQQALRCIQAEDDATLESFADVEKLRATVASHVTLVDNLMTSPPKHALVQMTKQLKVRLHDLEARVKCRSKVKAARDMNFNTEKLRRLHRDVSSLVWTAKEDKSEESEEEEETFYMCD